MSCGEPKNPVWEEIINRAAEQMSQDIDKQLMKQMYGQQSMQAISNPMGAQGANYGPVGQQGIAGYNYNHATTTTSSGAIYTSPSTMFNGGLTINGQNNAVGTLTTSGTGGLQWNGNYVQTTWDKPKIDRIADMLKDNMSKEIVMCKDREECQRKYGEYGLKLFDSMLSEVLGEAIKSEEAFHVELQLQLDKYNKIKALVLDHVPDHVKKQIACLELGLLG